MKYTAIINDQTYEIEISANNSVLVNGEPHTIDFRSIDGIALFSLLIDNASWETLVQREGDQYRVVIDGHLHVVDVQDERTRKIVKATKGAVAATGEIAIKAPMPGLVREVNVNAGDAVKARQSIVILEAMKMENEIRAPREGIVKEIRVKAGDKVEQGQVLVVVK
ncbi:MAG: biotin/lipoyl-binding protein [Chloroflexi bacterium]|nr:biotin/lipoyl-binding protein [Chloroflexota bacterium]MBI3742158.1 biotin/lipoyl-binding protein [Chloroflexota bacterium]